MCSVEFEVTHDQPTVIAKEESNVRREFLYVLCGV